MSSPEHGSDGQRGSDREPTGPNLTWLLVILALLVGVFWYRTRSPVAEPLFDPEAQPRPVTARGDLAADEQATIELFRKTSPSVVNITTLSRRRDMLRLRVEESPSGTGSGFVWDSQGHIVTNFHVIQKASGAQVTLADRSTWTARLVGAEPDKDIAVLKIDVPPTRLPPLLIGTSTDLLVGQKVFAIGNPFGLDQTLTTGVISALGREIQSVTQRPIQDVIQTNAAINPGNSGGPLLDSAGRLVGMNTAIYSPTGGSVGIGFAVPVDTINRIVPQLIRQGKVDRVGLGISIAADQVATQLGIEGVLVLEVHPETGAARAGLVATKVDDDNRVTLGDVIVSINMQKISDANDLYRALDNVAPGSKVQVRVRRGSSEIDVPVEVQLLSPRE